MCCTPLSLTLPPAGGGDTGSTPLSPALSPGGRGGFFLVRGKLPHRLRDLGRVGHEELLLRIVEGHRGYVRPGHSHDRSVQAVESVIGDDRGDLGTDSAGKVVLVHD